MFVYIDREESILKIYKKFCILIINKINFNCAGIIATVS